MLFLANIPDNESLESNQEASAIFKILDNVLCNTVQMRERIFPVYTFLFFYIFNEMKHT